MIRFTYSKPLLSMVSAAALVAALSLLLPGPAAWSEAGEGPAAPGGLSVLQRPEDTGKRIALTWEADPADCAYQVYRAQAPEGPYEEAGGKSSDSMLDYPVFLDDTVTPGVTYYYKVAAVDDNWLQGPPGRPVSARLEGTYAAAAGAKSILISITDQRVYFYEGDQLINIMRCSTGARPGSTPTGNFRVLQHMRYNVGCDYWMSFTAGHGMHGWPRYISRYEEGLGAPASHGCVRLHPMECYWPYFWAPDGTPIHITYASYSRRVVNGCGSTVGATRLSGDWYFAEGFTGGYFDTWLLLANPEDVDAEVRVDYLVEGGAMVSQDYALPPRSRFTVPVDGIPGLEDASFSLHAHSSRPIVAERVMYFTYDGKSDGSVTVGAPELSGDWYFAEGFSGGDFDTWLLLANPGEDVAVVQVDYLVEGGGAVRQEYTLLPRSRFSVWVDGVPGLEDASFSTRVSSPRPIVAERAMYFRKGYVDGGHVSMGMPQPSQQWYFAESCTRDFFESYILIGNATDQDAAVDVDFYLNEGSVRHSFVVAARSRFTVSIQTLPYLDYRDMAFTVYSSVPVVAERALYYSLDSHRGGQASQGSPRAVINWYFAEGYTGGAFDTWLLLANPGGEAAQMIVSFYREDGAVLDYYFIVDAWRRVTIHVDDLPGLEEASFAMAVRADKPVVAERAMYFTIPMGY